MLLLAILAAAASPLPGVVGPGNETCQSAMSPGFRDRAFDYIMGTWTGMNMAANKPTGRTVDVHVILKDVAEVCIAQPKLPLALAVLGIHMRYEKQNR